MICIECSRSSLSRPVTGCDHMTWHILQIGMGSGTPLSSEDPEWLKRHTDPWRSKWGSVWGIKVSMHKRGTRSLSWWDRQRVGRLPLHSKYWPPFLGDRSGIYCIAIQCVSWRLYPPGCRLGHNMFSTTWIVLISTSSPAVSRYPARVNVTYTTTQVEYLPLERKALSWEHPRESVHVFANTNSSALISTNYTTLRELDWAVSYIQICLSICFIVQSVTTGRCPCDCRTVSPQRSRVERISYETRVRGFPSQLIQWGAHIHQSKWARDCSVPIFTWV